MAFELLVAVALLLAILPPPVLRLRPYPPLDVLQHATLLALLHFLRLRRLAVGPRPLQVLLRELLPPQGLLHLRREAHRSALQQALRPCYLPRARAMRLRADHSCYI